MKTTYLMPDEPKDRIGPEDLDRLLGFLVKHDASDITIQTDEKIYAEIYGVLYQTTKRRMSKNEVAFLLNAIYGPNGTTQLSLVRIWIPIMNFGPVALSATAFVLMRQHAW